MTKPRLLITASTFPRWAGDTEPRFVYDLAKSLLPFFDVTVLAPSAPGALTQEVMEGVKVIRYRYFPIKRFETLCYPGAIVPRIRQKKSRAILVPFLLLSLWVNLLRRSQKFDIIHAHWLIPQGIVQCFTGNTPYMVTGHGADVTALNNSLFKGLKRRCLKKAGYVTAVSAHLMDEVRKIYPVPRSAVISMGCDTSEFGKQYAIQNYFQQDEEKVILFVGRLAEKKGVTYLIEAMKDIDARLCIVGDGPLMQSLRVQAEPQGDKIRFLGAKSHVELRNIYASADVFAAPSVTASDGDIEGFGLVLLEAMASGLPVVASNSGGIRDVVRMGENGILVEEKAPKALAVAINRLLEDEAEYNRLAEGGYATAARYDYSEVGKRYAELLLRMLK